ncbi:SMP-30/gluconolactonase/LRE family protein [Methylocystis sp. SC2]|uniref:SMP-30/gluconolactonase/LRE family protein n=1 Tax=Methylocystis sp. (strain SC2) TaxID=187303 RepID=UPI00027AF237|nr:SMP-30/gluconolactonase/LRE family protein [Methylocystis sp. SC2]CCJ08929.1 Putative gluconolactonase with senescence marker [Methylocystis sp. SC2]
MTSRFEHFEQVELVHDARAITGESPTWSEREQRLYWIDIEEPALHRFDPSSGEDERWVMPCQIGAFALCRSGDVLVALRLGLARISLFEGNFASLDALPYNPLSHRFNEGKCDARGRFWIGAKYDPLPSPPGERSASAAGPLGGAAPVHLLAHGQALTSTSASAVIANGMAWSPDNRIMYFADTPTRRVTAFDFDIESGALSSPRTFAQFERSDGKPDGAAVDSDGFYWCALYGGGRILRIAPSGAIDRQIHLPVSQPTMCAFGDADYRSLYVTSASQGVSKQQEPHAGGIFRCRPGVEGRPPNLFADEAPS